MPIDSPLGRVAIERDASVTYSDDELDLCAEFARCDHRRRRSNRVLAGRHANEMDVQTASQRELIDRIMRSAHETAFLQRQP